MKFWSKLLVMGLVLSFTSCGDDEPQPVNTEDNEKTMQLREQYESLVVGTWWYEHVTDNVRFFERLTFGADGTLKGIRTLQTRQLVAVGEEQLYTDWETATLMNGTFTGRWELSYCLWQPLLKRNCLVLVASYDDDENRDYMAYSGSMPFEYANDETLCFGGIFADDELGWSYYHRGEGTPSFLINSIPGPN